MEASIAVEHYHFNYYSLGQPSTPSILFLHGFMGDCHEFDEVISLLSNQFYCLAVDLPGHGKTKTTDEAQYYTMSRTADGLIQFIESLQLKPCFLVGYSMGGRLALYLTLHFPQYFLKVILESASAGLKTQAERDQRIQQDLKLAQQLETEDFLSFIVKWYNQPLFASIHNHSKFEKMRSHRLQNDPIHLAKSLRNMGTGCQPPLLEKLKQNMIPILLLVGELDKKFIAINTEMTERCKVLRLEIVKSCGHNIHFENPTLFVKQLINFLTTS